MRITHVIASLDPAMGGPPMVAARLAAAQATLGYETRIVCYSAENESVVRKSLAHIPGFEQVSVHSTPITSRLERFTGSALRRLLVPLVRPGDFMHLHGVWESILPAAARLARRLGVPYAVAPHGMLDPWSLNQRGVKKRIALALVYRQMLTSAAFLHALNADEARLLEPLKLGVPVKVIPNGVFLDEIDPLPPVGRFVVRHPALRGKPFVLFLSRLHYKKGLDFLADAFATVAERRADVQLVVAGPDEGERSVFVQRLGAMKLPDGTPLSSRVHLVGPLYGQDKYEALVDAACFCLPSRQEGFSIAILEAMACGLPVVVSDACHFPEVARSGAGRVVPLDAAPLAEALGEVLDDEPLRRRMGAAGRALVAEQYTWPQIARFTRLAYLDAVAEAGREEA